MSWDDEARRQVRRAGKPPNRRTVEIIICPTCGGTDIRCTRYKPEATFWHCNAGAGCPDWKEPPTAGEAGRGYIAPA